MTWTFLVVGVLLGAVCLVSYWLHRRLVRVEALVPSRKRPALTSVVVDPLAELVATESLGESHPGWLPEVGEWAPSSPPRLAAHAAPPAVVPVMASTVDMVQVHPEDIPAIGPMHPPLPPLRGGRIRADVLTARIRAEQGQAR